MLLNLPQCRLLFAEIFTEFARNARNSRKLPEISEFSNEFAGEFIKQFINKSITQSFWVSKAEVNANAAFFFLVRRAEGGKVVARAACTTVRFRATKTIAAYAGRCPAAQLCCGISRAAAS